MILLFYNFWFCTLNVTFLAKMLIVVENLARTFTTQIKICYATTCAYKFRKGGVII
jgi:hypothetical protein